MEEEVEVEEAVVKSGSGGGGTFGDVDIFDKKFGNFGGGGGGGGTASDGADKKFGNFGGDGTEMDEFAEEDEAADGSTDKNSGNFGGGGGGGGKDMEDSAIFDEFTFSKGWISKGGDCFADRNSGIGGGGGKPETMLSGAEAFTKDEEN
ncbi:hypothetical protein WICMUC_002853 [Wickerhamomyces mucosus]|uniref:Uncharacterized protein n=1 Tax=Wickerhamomyces mucosus TaxID=1378264 RepID=A0A9P8TE49_9ASCO|nr:hypothetical protein WICMUC_002853 [Wickerhamomyces mucosus]